MEFIDKTPFLRIAKIKTSQGYAGTDREDIGVICADESASELAWDHAINDGDGTPMVCSECGAEEGDCDCEDATLEEDTNHNIEGYWVALEPEDLGEYARDILDILVSNKLAYLGNDILEIPDTIKFCQAFGFSHSPDTWQAVLKAFELKVNTIISGDDVLANSEVKHRYLMVTRTITTLEKVEAMTEKTFKDISRDGDILEYTKVVSRLRDKLSYRNAYAREIPE